MNDADKKPQSADVRPYVIKTYDRWIILVIVLAGGWFLFRPVFAVITAYRGVTFESQLIESTAEHYYRKAIAIDPHTKDGWLDLGQLYYFWSHNDPKRSTEAAQIFADGTKAVPNDSELPFDLGRVYLVRLHDYPRAENALHESLQRNTQSTPELRRRAEFSWDYLGYAALDSGDRRYAIQCWRQVLKLDPNHGSAREAIAKYGG